MTTYCDYCNSHPEDTYNKTYHDTQYGFPLDDDNLLFERLVLEINQAGLSWITILKKADGFRKAYHGFKIEKVARYTEKDRARLLADAGIIRNRLKVAASIGNAQAFIAVQEEFGSFDAYIWRFVGGRPKVNRFRSRFTEVRFSHDAPSAAPAPAKGAPGVEVDLAGY